MQPAMHTPSSPIQHPSIMSLPTPRRSRRLSPNSIPELFDPFDYPGPKHNSLDNSFTRIPIGRITKPNVRRLKFTKNSNSAPTTTLSNSLLSTQHSHQEYQQLSDPTHNSSSLSLAFQPEGHVLCREHQAVSLSNSLSLALHPNQPSVGIYVCGTPGTGKTYTVSKVTNRLCRTLDLQSNTQYCLSSNPHHLPPTRPPFRQLWVNCANLSNPKHLFSYIADQLDISTPHTNPRDAIREYASSCTQKLLIVLDEVDFLTSKDQMVLYSAFEWPKIKKSRIVVVGIANSIDLPVRLLPWLRQAGCMPQVVSFPPYSASSLQKIAEQRIDNLDTSALTTVAISLAAKKVAAGSGDARLMLDVCREAQSEMRRNVRDRSCVQVVSSILSERGGLSVAVDTIRQLPVQQQLALCVAANAAFFSSQKTSASGKMQKKATIGGLYDSFVRMCQRAHVSVLSFPEFADVCSNALTHHGLVDILSTGRGKSAKTLRSRAIRLRVPIEDVRAGIAEKGFLPMLLVK